MNELVERLRATMEGLECEADLSRRTAETYSPERAKWEAGERSQALSRRVRYQVQEEGRAKALTRDAQELKDAIAALEAADRMVERVTGDYDASEVAEALTAYRTATQKKD